MRSERALTVGGALAAWALAGLLGGCARTIAENSVVDAHAADEQAFWSGLETRRAVTNHDAIHGFLLASEGADPHATYEERVEAAIDRGWFPESATDETRPANQSATMGDLAVAACRIAGIKGGVTMRALGGATPRYATKELVFLEVIPERSESQAINGLEFIDLIGKVQDRAGRGAELTADPRRVKPAPGPAQPVEQDPVQRPGRPGNAPDDPPAGGGPAEGEPEAESEAAPATENPG